MIGKLKICFYGNRIKGNMKVRTLVKVSFIKLYILSLHKHFKQRKKI